MALADKVNRTIDEVREFTALADAERAAEDARRKPQPEVTADNAVPPVDREHELSRSAELLVLAGLLDSRTGLPVWDRAELLGALLGFTLLLDELLLLRRTARRVGDIRRCW